MRLHEVQRGCICGFQYWSIEDGCWKPRVVIVMKKGYRPDGTPRTLGLDLGQGDWRSFLEPHVKDLRIIYMVAAEKSEDQAREFAKGFEGAASPEWLVLYALADSARVVHGLGAPHAVFAFKRQKQPA